jgi:hypothetical protein
MSIKIMEQVFKDENLDSNKKLIMLAMGDNANDEGFCYPSTNNIVSKTSLSKPTVIKHLKELELLGVVLSQKRHRSNGSATSKIYVLYPSENLQKLDDELKAKFTPKLSSFTTQSKEALPGGQSKEALPPKGGQSKEALPLEPSLTLFNHHLFNILDKNEKDLFLEYCSLRKKMKLQTTLKIQERLLQKYIDYGRNPEIIQNAISSNWKDFYPPKQLNQNQQSNQQVKYPNVDPFDLYVDYRENKGMLREVAETRVIQETGMKFPATDRFLKSTAQYEYQKYKAQEANKPKPMSDEEWEKHILENSPI